MTSMVSGCRGSTKSADADESFNGRVIAFGLLASGNSHIPSLSCKVAFKFGSRPSSVTVVIVTVARDTPSAVAMNPGVGMIANDVMTSDVVTGVLSVHDTQTDPETIATPSIRAIMTSPNCR